MKANQAQYDITGIGMCIIDYILDYQDSPSIGEEIRAQLTYHTKGDHWTLMEKIYSFDKVQRNLGGSTSNTLRTVNKILNRNGVLLIGSVGKDPNADYIRNQLTKEGINIDLYTAPNEPTANVIVLVDNKERELYATIGASSHLSIDFMKKNTKSFGNSSIVYSDAYLIPYIPEVYEYVYSSFSNSNGNSNGPQLGLGFADYELLIEHYPKLSKIIPHCDILFMNKKEFITWTQVSNSRIKEELTDKEFELNVLRFLNKKSEEKVNKNKTFIVVITQGKKDAIVYWKNYKDNISNMIKEPKWDYDESKVIDTNGVGDSFAGGFLSGLLLGKSYSECAVIGHYTAAKVLKLKGFQVPDISIEDIELALKERQGNSNSNSNSNKDSIRDDL